ncbi:MAG: biopolymer transporter ExbD [Bacteroidota bacterium]
MASDRTTPTIPTASLADIAFLLLVFFLVATTIGAEMGLPATLPGIVNHPASVAPETLLSVDVRADGRIALNGSETSAEDLRQRVADHAAAGPHQRVALRTARETPYTDYISVFDAILLGHRDVNATPRLTLREPIP